ncbi:MAG: 2'-5' RNA ligase family protein, partial [Cellulomonadaceae bacterium]|nr:2'-5' RNA ligase family protein [Cellulomonadaceae bacterium]
MRLFTCIYPSETALAHLDLALVNLPDMATAAFESEIANFDGPSATQFSRGQFSRDQFSSGQRGRGHRGGKESRPRGGRSSQDQKLRWVPPEFRHITLAFHGDVPEGAVPDYLGELRNAVQDFEPFEARLSGSGAFSGRTLWTGVSGSEGLSQLKSLSTLVAEAAVEASLRSDNRA